MGDGEQDLGLLAEAVILQLGKQGKKLATAESCTGGLIAGQLTEIPGSSDVLDRGFVTYSNEAKKEMLGVQSETLEKFGAVSAETAVEMASGALKNSNSDASVAVTGIAGPGGGSEEKPVGLVFIAVANTGDGGTFVEEFNFGEISRAGIRRDTIEQALEMVLGYCVDETESN